MKVKLLILAAVLAVMLIPIVVNAQVCNFDLRYDPQSVATISGTVITTFDYNPGDPMNAPKAVLVQSGNQVYKVFLGPGWYLNQLGLNPCPGDMVSVVGSSRMVGCGPYLVASIVTIGNRAYALRSCGGAPLWRRATNTCPPVGMGPGCDVPVMFDMSKPITIDGDVRTTYSVFTGEGAGPSVAVVIIPTTTDMPYTTVILGPRDYLKSRGIWLRSGDHIWVRGAAIKPIDVYPAVVATEVIQGNEKAELRTSVGVPIWTFDAR